MHVWRVPQCSVLSLILFIFYTADLISTVKQHTIHPMTHDCMARAYHLLSLTFCAPALMTWSPGWEWTDYSSTPAKLICSGVPQLKDNISCSAVSWGHLPSDQSVWPQHLSRHWPYLVDTRSTNCSPVFCCPMKFVHFKKLHHNTNTVQCSYVQIWAIWCSYYCTVVIFSQVCTRDGTFPVFSACSFHSFD